MVGEIDACVGQLIECLFYFNGMVREMDALDT